MDLYKENLVFEEDTGRRRGGMLICIPFVAYRVGKCITY